MLNPNILENVIVPSIEMGAYEALWLDDVKSFKQLREKLGPGTKQRLSNLVSREKSKQCFELARKILKENHIEQFGVVLAGTIDFPIKLSDAIYPLEILYYQGNWDLAFSQGVSVVGTRKPSQEGIKRTQQLVRELVNAGYTIFSGLAAGIDTAAHQAAIDCNGSTVAVIGTPLSKYYPKSNCQLQKLIARKHLLISQVPIVCYEKHTIEFTRMFFPERNKTMSALTQATIVVEAGETSGTLIQATEALKQGRKVFILENNFQNNTLSWPEKLLKKGAFRVKNINDILERLVNCKPD